jgi:hypothetical protein
VSHVEVDDADTETTNVVSAERRAAESGAQAQAGATVFLLSIAAFDCEPDEYEVGGTVMIAEVDLNTAFAGNAEPRSEAEALAFAANTLRQLDGFPAQLRAEAHTIAARAVEAHPAASQALSALLATDDAPSPIGAPGDDANPVGAR